MHLLKIELVSMKFHLFSNKINFQEKMIEMGYEREAIVNSVTNRAYDEIYATYMLLGMKEPEVKINVFFDQSKFVVGGS